MTLVFRLRMETMNLNGAVRIHHKYVMGCVGTDSKAKGRGL